MDAKKVQELEFYTLGNSTLPSQFCNSARIIIGIDHLLIQLQPAEDLTDHYIGLKGSTEQPQVSQDSSSVTLLRYLCGVWSFLDVTKEQLIPDLPEWFWICSLAMATMAFNDFVQVQLPKCLGVLHSIMWLAGSGLRVCR